MERRDKPQSRETAHVEYDSYCVYCKAGGKDTLVDRKRVTASSANGVEKMYDNICDDCYANLMKGTALPNG